MNVIAIGMQIAQLALWALILYFICPFIGMPENTKRICQALIVLIAIFASLQVVLAGSVHTRPISNITSPPPIIKPTF